MARRTRIDTAAGALEAAQAVGRAILPPAHVPLTEADGPFWLSVIAARAAVEWTAQDLECAALLARTMRQLENEQRLLATEGAVLATDKGSLFANPRVAVVHGMHAQIKGWRQTLGIHSRGLQGEARDVQKRRAHAKVVEAGLAADDFEGLLAGGLN